MVIGSARVDSKGKYSGDTAGDQKQTSGPDYKGEVSMQEMYQHKKGWYILRPKRVDYADEIAKAMERACNNKNIGYDQADRLQIMTYGTSTNTPCDCDCSSLVRRCIKEGTGIDVGNFTTGNERAKLIASGMFFDIGTYVTQSITPLFNGDVLVTKEKGHTVIVVSGNPRIAKDTEKYPKYTGTAKSLTDALRQVGENDTSIEHRTEIASHNGMSNYKGAYDQNVTLLRLLKCGELIK